MRNCDIPECSEKHKGHGLCNKHLLRQRRNGTTADPVKSLAERFASKIDRDGPPHPYDRDLGPCHLWTGAVNEHGYGVMRPEGQRSGPALRAHRVALIIAGRDPGDLPVLHSCDNPPCVNPEQLHAGTKAENSREMVTRDRHARGERSGTAKLAEGQVVEILRRRAAGEMYRDIAASYGVHRGTVGDICRGKSWRHIDRNAVTPPCSEVIVSALVECITGEDVAA